MRTYRKKAIIIFAILMAITGMIAACGKKSPEQAAFRAVITEIGNGTMLVTPVEGSEELKSADSFSVPIEHMEASPEPQVGDIVEITYDGGIQETYPAGLDHVYSIKVIEKRSETDNTGSTLTVESCIPENSVLWFPDDENAARLIADMTDGKIPTECNVLYDQMGSLPDVTVTDPDEIMDLYNRFVKMSLGAKSEMSITDCYHHISFHLQDGTWVSWSFEGEDLLNRGRENYEVKDEGNLWTAVRALQEELMEKGENLDQPADSDAAQNAETASVGGPYGKITAAVPENWKWEAKRTDEEGLLTGGLYGLILQPADAGDGQIEVVCTDSFGVCGTGLVQKDFTLAGEKASFGTYDDHEHWDFIVFDADDEAKKDAQIVAQHTDCDSWPDKSWEEALLILDTVRFDRTQTEGGIGQFIPESENEEIAVIMDVHQVTPRGLTVRFRQYDETDTDELTYGEGYTLVKQNGGKWDPVPTIIEEYGFNDIGYTIPAGGETELEEDWEWLYGTLSPGTYRISKTVIEGSGDGRSEYVFSAQFLIAG